MQKELEIDIKKRTAGYRKQRWKLGVGCTLITRGRGGRQQEFKDDHHWPQKDMASVRLHEPLEKGVREEKQGRKGRRRHGGDINHGRMPPPHNVVKSFQTEKSGLLSIPIVLLVNCLRQGLYNPGWSRTPCEAEDSLELLTLLSLSLQCSG